MPLSEAKSLLKRVVQSSGRFHPSARTHPRTQHAHMAKQATLAPGKNGSVAEAAAARHIVSDSQATRSAQPFHILEHDPLADRNTLNELVDSLYEFSPIVGLEQTDAPESIFLDITGLGHLFGDETRLVASVIEHCRKQGYLVRAHTAPTLGLAWARAHYGDSHTPLESLPAESLRLTATTEDVLFQLGIETVGQLLQIPRADLTSRFGDEIHRRLDQAMGIVDEPITARHRPPDFMAEQFIEFPTSDRETIEVILSRLITELCDQLRARQQGALQWTVRLGCVEGPPVEFQVNLFQPTATVDHVMQLAQMQLDTALRPHTRNRRARPNSGKKSVVRRYTTFEVQEVTASVTSCVLLAERQRKLFDENPRLDKQTLAHLINRLASRLGQQNVVYPTLQSGAQPEYSVRLRPLVDPRRRRSRKTQPVKPRSHVMARPLRLINPPLLLETAEQDRSATSPPTIQRPPALLTHQQRRQTVIRCWGPERIETGWWRGPTTRRDYWRVETCTGQQFWIFFELRRRQWYLHGEF